MTKRNFMTLLVGSIFLMVCVATTRAYAGEDVRNSQTKGLQKTMGNDLYRAFTINNIFNWYSNTGDGSYNYITAQSGFFFPKGSSRTATFEDGLVWGGFHKGRSTPSVGGSTYWRGLQAGAILTPGTATTDPVPDNADLAKYRIYVVRPDINPKTPFASVQEKVEAEAALVNTWQTLVSEQELYDQYVQDWNEWPAKDGLPAPYKDVNGDGRYDPAIDIPGQPSADQTLYYVANDVSPTRTTAMYGSPPIGLEMHRTIWGYNLTGALGNTIFESSLLINKSGAPLDSAFLVQWSDVDLGDAGDDYTGCDVARGLGYTYNGKPIDEQYGVQVPATGYTFFQGPIVRTDNPNDVAVFRLKYRPGYKNLGMTTFVFFINGNATYVDPRHGTGGDIEWYRLMNAQITSSGAPFINPNTNQPTEFTLDGDPVAGTGWIDGTYGLIPGDRRQCQVTGPFTLANGDTQEVVVAHLIGLGSDRISSIAVLRWYSDLAQSAYNNLFNIPFPPPSPKVTTQGLDREVVLYWGADATEIEKFTSVGYAFEGYNVYQFPDPSPDLSTGVRLATYDLINTVTTIFDDVYDPSTGYVIRKPVEFGADVGIKRYYETTTDAIRSLPLANGTPYYFGVSSYSFNPVGVPSHLESAPDLLTVIPQSPKPGVTYGAGAGSDLEPTHSGTADGGPNITIIDPTATTGHTYEAYFTQRAEIRTPDGDWVASSSLSRAARFARPDTMTGSSIDIAAVYGKSAGVYELHCTLNLESSDFAYSDGIRMSLPAGLRIIDVPSFAAGNGNISPTWSGNTISMGDTTHPYTGSGPFAGGEEWVIYVSGLTVPAVVSWKIFDDGYGGPLDAVGTTTIQNIGSAARTAKYWNLKDNTTGAVKLENNSVVNGVALFPPRNDVATNFGAAADPILDGVQIHMSNVVYAAPINFLSTTLTPGPGSTTELTHNNSTSTLDIQNYTIFAATVSSKSIDNFGAGTNDINQLQKDYQLRFTGVLDTAVVDGQTRITVRSGGQLATIFSTATAAAGLATHPLNPNPGVAQPFLIRIPFEVWCIDDNRQVNLAFRDRAQTPTANPFYAWNPVNRMYAVIVNGAYNPNTPTPPNADATWVLVFYGTNYSLGDVVTVKYANPIQFDVDKWTFSTQAAAYSSALAATDASKINVFPNPYIGFNPLERDKYNRFVTFSHLPKKATIRIFNLAGVLVRTLMKDVDDQFFEWDLKNESGFPVAAGMYIVYIDMPDIGATKTLKLGVIPEQQYIDRW